MTMNKKKSVKQTSKEIPKSQRYQNLKNNSELSKLAKQKAHSVVLTLLDVKIDKEYLAKNIVYITRENFDDVAIERSLIGVCGYALCDQPLIDPNLKNQTYIIRNNKVYDVTQRKNFCSNKCYQAFELVLHQIPTIPLYVRAEDKEIQNMKIIVPVLENLKGIYGKRVNITGTAFDIDAELDDGEDSTQTVANDRLSPDLSEEDQFSSTNQLTSTSKEGLVADDRLSPDLSEEDQFSSTNELTLTSKEGLGRCTNNHSKPNLLENDILHAEEHKESENFTNAVNHISINSTKENRSSSNDALISVDTETDLLKEVQNISLDPTKKKLTAENGKTSIVGKNEHPNVSQADEVLEIERVLREWMTFESLRIILGDVYVKGMLEHFGEIWEHYDRSSDMQFPRLDMKAKYIALCKKLNRQEMSERLEEAQVEIKEELEIPDRESLKPMPNYERLQKDIQQSSLKVKAFFEGTEEFMSNKEVLEVIEEEPEEVDTDKPTSTKRTKKATKPLKNEEDRVITLPLIDQYSQKAWRKEIVFEKLGKRLSEFSVDFGLNEREVRRLVIPLIETFDLTAQNIIFKTSQWRFVALVIIKMLSARYPIIAKVFLPTEKSFPMITSYLRTMGRDEYYLDRLLSYVTDVSYILAKTEKVVSLESDYEEETSRVAKSFKLPQDVKSKELKSSFHSTDYEQLD